MSFHSQKALSGPDASRINSDISTPAFVHADIYFTFSFQSDSETKLLGPTLYIKVVDCYLFNQKANFYLEKQSFLKIWEGILFLLWLIHQQKKNLLSWWTSQGCYGNSIATMEPNHKFGADGKNRIEYTLLIPFGEIAY